MNPVDYNIKDNDPAYSAAKWLMSEEYFYNDDQDIVPDTHVIAQFTSGLIGDKKSIKQLQNKNLIVSPMTVSQCIPDCIALLNYIASD